MKITKEYLRTVIKEELENNVSEAEQAKDYYTTEEGINILKMWLEKTKKPEFTSEILMNDAKGMIPKIIKLIEGLNFQLNQWKTLGSKK